MKCGKPYCACIGVCFAQQSPLNDDLKLPGAEMTTEPKMPPLSEACIYQIADSPKCNPDTSGWGPRFSYVNFAHAICAARDQQWSERVTVLENKLFLSDEAGRVLSSHYAKRGERLQAAHERVAELEHVLGVAREALRTCKMFSGVNFGAQYVYGTHEVANAITAIDAAQKPQGE